MSDVHLTGLLVCADPDEADVVAGHLGQHVALTRAEPGCLSFHVEPTSDPLVWAVAEHFVDAASFAAHQERVAASEWGRATAGIERRYSVEGLPDGDVGRRTGARLRRQGPVDPMSARLPPGRYRYEPSSQRRGPDRRRTMTVTTVLAVVPASDLAASRTWWTRLWGREPDEVPMPSDVEWHVPGGGGVQLVDDGGRAGSGSVTLGVDDVDAEVAAIRERGIDAPQAETVPSGQFRVALLRDPDGNTVVLGQALGA